MGEMEARAVRLAAQGTTRSIQGWLFGTLLVLFGALLFVWMLGDVRGELASSPDQGTFSVKACQSASDGGYKCTGSFGPETGGASEHGTLSTDHRVQAGATLDVEESYASFTENTYKEVPGNRLGGNVLVLGLTVVMLAAGAFSLLTGYCPRPLYDGFGRWANAYHDRRRVTFTQAWARCPARKILAPLLGVVAGVGVVTLVIGVVMVALA